MIVAIVWPIINGSGYFMSSIGTTSTNAAVTQIISGTRRQTLRTACALAESQIPLVRRYVANLPVSLHAAGATLMRMDIHVYTSKCSILAKRKLDW